MMRKKIIAILYSINLICLNAQEGNLNMPQIFPCSPDTYNLGSYGNVSIGEYTGTMQHDVSLFEYSIGDIKLPISLQYSSNGIKVDDYNPVVGLGWTLSAGGVISKIMRDYDDLENDFHAQKFNSVAYGLKLNFFENVIIQDKFDTEKDLFRVNIPGTFSNTFVKKGDNFDNNEWLQEKKTDFKIERIRDQYQNISFIITSPTGVKYYFEMPENSISRSTGLGWSPPDVSFGSAYFLTKIEDTKNNILTIEYAPETLSYTISRNEIYNFFENTYYITCQTVDGPLLAGIPGLKKGTNLIRYETFRIKKISNNINNNIIEFNYSTKLSDLENRYAYLDEIISSSNNLIDKYKFDYLITQNNRVFLTEVSSNITNRKYEFNYLNPQILPKRLSYAQDFWGYYNGATQNTSLIGKVNHPYLENINYSFANREINSTLSPSGMLSKIVYPTGGHTDIFYESHSEWGAKTVEGQVKSKNLAILTDQETSNKVVSTTFHSGKKQKIKFFGGAQYNQDCTYPMTHQVQVHLKVKNLSTGLFETLSQLNTSGYVAVTNPYFYPNGENEFYLDTEVGKDYEVSLEVFRMCFGGGVSFSYIDVPDTTYDTNLPAGGNRVERVEHYDNSSPNPVVEKWYYGTKENPTRSSGVAYYKPVHWKYSEGFVYCPPSNQNPLFYEYTPYQYVSVYSNSLIPLFGNESQNISYNYVTKSIGGNNFEKGGKFTEYTVGLDPLGSIIFGANSYRGGNFTNSSWNKGFVNKTEDFVISNSTFKTVREITNEYYYNNDNHEEIDNYIGIKYGSPQMIEKYSYQCTASDIIAQNVGYNPCYGKPLNYPVPYLEYTTLMMFGEVLHYKFISHDYHLIKTSTKQYLDNGEANTYEKFYYTNSSHFQPTTKEFSDTDGKILTTNYQYAHEKGNTYLTGKNMIDIPLETELIKKKDSSDSGTTISKSETIYPYSQSEADSKTSGLPLPISVSSLNVQTNTMSTEVIYKKYDPINGNLLQYNLKPNATEDSGNPVAIIWGYNKTQPIAKIEGAAYDQVSGYISEIVDASEKDNNPDLYNLTPEQSEQNLIDKLDEFRKKTELSGFQITTYTYDPLIGLKSITPPSGIREVYIYDTANRLQSVKDVEGKILKEFDYHYKQ